MKSTLLLFIFSLNLFANQIPYLDELTSTHQLDERLASGDHVGNGGGLAESHFAFAKFNLKEIIQGCLNSNLCLTFSKEREIAKNVLNILSKEQSIQTQLSYVTGRNNPNFFFLDGNTRVAKTGNSAGDTIYINRDLIYDHRANSIDYSQAVAILFHEFGHHTGFHDHDYLDMVGAKIGMYLSRKRSTLATFYGKVTLPKTKKRLLKLEAINMKKAKESLILTGKNKNIDLTNMILNKIKNDVKESCLNQNDKCQTFLGLKNGNYSINAHYFEDAIFTKFVTSKIEREAYFIKLNLNLYTHFDSNKASAQFYHLKSNITFLTKLDRIEHKVQSVELSELKIEDFFGIKF